MTVRLTDYQRFKLEYWYCHMQEDIARWNAAPEVVAGSIKATEWDMYGTKATMVSLEKKGIVKDIRLDGSSYVGFMTDLGKALAAEIGAAKKLIEEAEKVVKESHPDKLLERKWDESLQLARTHINSHGPDNERVSVTLHITFANHRAAEMFRLDLAGVFLKYHKGKKA